MQLSVQLSSYALVGDLNRVQRGGLFDKVAGTGNNNVVFQNGSIGTGYDNARIDGNGNVVQQRSGDDSVVWGNGNEVHQDGTGNRVEIGDQGFLSTGIGGKQGNHNRVNQIGDHNSATIHGDDGQVRQHGDNNQATSIGNGNHIVQDGTGNTTRVKGNNVNVRVQGNHNDINLDSDLPEGMRVYGDHITVRQENGRPIAVDQDGNQVPITRGRDGAYVVGTPPKGSVDDPDQTSQTGRCRHQPNVRGPQNSQSQQGRDSMAPMLMLLTLMMLMMGLMSQGSSGGGVFAYAGMFGSNSQTGLSQLPY